VVDKSGHSIFYATLLGVLSVVVIPSAVSADELIADQLYERGYQENESGQLAKAIVDFTAVIQKNPEYWKAYANRGAAKYHSHDYGSALEDLNIAIAHLPEVQALKDLKKATEEAIANSAHGPQTVVFRRPGHVNSYQPVATDGAQGIANLANTLMAHGYAIPKDLVHPMTGSLIHPIGGPTDSASQCSAQDYFERGCEKAKSMDFAGAIKDFDECIKLDPKHGLAYANRGAARQQTGDTKGALEDLNKAVELLPGNQGVKQMRDRMMIAG
jgi:tetratricopeptide (TPR) repeat protein